MSEDPSGKPFPNQCDRECDEGRVDRISQLPDDIIVHILSFLCLKRAVSTSILSTRWLDLWKHKPDLKFYSIKISPKNFTWVNSVLDSYKALSLKELSIAFYLNRSSQLEVTKWLKFGFSRKVERLGLDFRVANGSGAAVLDEILRESKIPACDFKSLKELKLAHFKVGDEAIKLLLNCCKLLEKLTIQGATLTSDIEFFGKLKHLDISARCSLNSINISCAPNLTWLSLDHSTQRVSIKNVPNLVMMDVRCQTLDAMHDFASIAAHLETLTITLYLPQSRSLSFPEMPSLKKLTLLYEEVEIGKMLPITSWIQASPRLQEFNLEITDLSLRWAIFEVPKAGNFPHHHLKVFEFSGFFGPADDQRELLWYIVNNCVELQKMKIVTLFPPPYQDGFISAEQIDTWKKIKQVTEELLAQKVPDHIQVLVM